MPAPADDAALDREWQTLQRKIGRSRGFCWLVLFVADERAAARLKERLRDSLRAKTAHLTVIAVESPAELAAKSIGEIFESADLPEHREVCAPFWLEATRGFGDRGWDDARRELLMRLNERRSRLEAEVRCPLIVLLPDGWQREAASLAPDLWHVRIHSAVLRPAPAAPDDGGMPFAAEPAADRPEAVAPPESAGGVPRELAYWKRQLNAVGAGSWWKRALNALRGAPGSESLSLRDGVAAVDALLERSLLVDAREVSDDLLERARERVAAGGEQSLRELGLVLQRVGKVDKAQGRLAAAARAYDESLELCRRLLREHGESPQALRDLSVSLERVGDAAEAQGRLDAAARAYDESLELCRRLLREHGESPPALRDLSISLNKVGDVAEAQGRFDAAARAYDESLELCRRLLREHGESPQALRDLSVSLDKVGDVAKAQGRLDAAARAYDESLELCRRLLREHGESPQALSDLSVSLNRVGNVAASQGRLDAATAAYGESLQLVRRLAQQHGETPRALDHLAVGLERVATLDAIDPQRRAAAADEALRIRRRLVKAYPGLDYHQWRLEATQRLADSLQPTSFPNP